MRAHYLQHVPFEGLGSIENSLQQRGYEITVTRLYENNHFPAISDIDVLIVMGGPMSVNDENQHPWIIEEKHFIRNCIEQNKPILGVCLGAQFIASCMGARIFQGDEKEIGWFPIQAVANKSERTFCFPNYINVFHWHGETFDLPKGAVHLAKSEPCQHQAFQLGERVIGLQFHLETTPESAQAIVQHCGDELVDAVYIQDADTILSASSENYQCINSLMDQIIDYITR